MKLKIWGNAFMTKMQAWKTCMTCYGNGEIPFW